MKSSLVFVRGTISLPRIFYLRENKAIIALERRKIYIFTPLSKQNQTQKEKIFMKEEFIIKSANDYIKKIKMIFIDIFAASIALFIIFIMFFNDSDYTLLAVISISLILISAILLILVLIIHKTELYVSNKRVFGRTILGNRVDLPLDSISAIGCSLFKGIFIGTSAGKIAFLGIGNRDAIYDAIANLLITRQNTINVSADNTCNNSES